MIMQKIFLFNNFPKNLIKKSQIKRLVNEIYTIALENIEYMENEFDFEDTLELDINEVQENV